MKNSDSGLTDVAGVERSLRGEVDDEGVDARECSATSDVKKSSSSCFSAAADEAYHLVTNDVLHRASTSA